MKKKIAAIVLTMSLLTSTTAFAFYARTSATKTIPTGTIHCFLEGNEGWGKATTDLDRSAYGNQVNAWASVYIEGTVGSYTVIKSGYSTGNWSNPYHAEHRIDGVNVTEWHSSHSTDEEPYGYNYQGMLLRVQQYLFVRETSSPAKFIIF